jgi:hypothetical protein
MTTPDWELLKSHSHNLLQIVRAGAGISELFSTSFGIYRLFQALIAAGNYILI